MEAESGTFRVEQDEMAALEDAAAGRPVDLGAAAREAHAPAGALGTYGRAGALFAEIERVLDREEGATCGDEPEADLTSCAERVRRALAELA